MGPKAQDMGGYTKPPNKLQQGIKTLIKEKVGLMKGTNMRLIASYTNSIEEWALEAAYGAEIPFDLYLPNVGYEDQWPDFKKTLFAKMKHRAQHFEYLDKTRGWDFKKMANKDTILLAKSSAVYHFFPKPFKLFTKFPKVVQINLLSEVAHDDYFIKL